MTAASAQPKNFCTCYMTSEIVESNKKYEFFLSQSLRWLLKNGFFQQSNVSSSDHVRYGDLQNRYSQALFKILEEYMSEAFHYYCSFSACA